MQLLLLGLEMLAALVLIRRWGFVRKAYLEALGDCWKLRKHIFIERRRVQGFRKRGDLFMLRFLRLRPNRWDEVKRMQELGIPRINPHRG